MTEIYSIVDTPEYTENLKGVIFDLDDTLYSEKEYVKSGFCAIAREYPNIKDMYERLWAAFLEKKPAIDEVLLASGLANEKERCLEIYRNHVPDSLKLYDGAEEMLLSLRECGIKTGIITDGRPNGQWAKIRALGLCDKVDRIIVTDELGGVQFRKPCEAAYVVMCKELGLGYSEAAYVGDNAAKDFIAPEKLGMVCIHFCNKDGIYYEG